MSPCRPTINCPCNKAFLQEIFSYTSPPEGETNFNIDADKYKRAYDKCKICGHFFARHDIDLDDFYESDYVTCTYGGVEGMVNRLEKILSLPVKDSDNHGRAERIKKYAEKKFGSTRKDIKLLDVGSGIGVFPAVIKNTGWEVDGIEPDPRTSMHLQDNVGIRTHDNLSSINPKRTGFYDIVTFNKVLEHVENPASMLSLCVNILKPISFIYIELPDTSASEEGPEREEFSVDHYHVFTIESCALLAEKTGFSVQEARRIREPSGKYSLYAFIEKLK